MANALPDKLLLGASYPLGANWDGLGVNFVVFSERATAVQLVLSLTILLLARSGFGGIGGAFRSPVWMWLGGVMGLTVVFAITFAQPRIGATATIGILIAGQLVMGALIDRFGLFGVDPIAISAPRAIGIVLLGIGASLSLVR